MERRVNLNQIIQWLDVIWQSLQAVIDFVIARIDDTVYLVGLFIEMIPALPAFFTWLPGVIIQPLMTLFAVVVIFRFLGMGD